MSGQGEDSRKVRINPLDTLDRLDAREGSTSEGHLEEGVGANYTLLEPVGQGAMGHIHIVAEKDLGRHVALKRLLPEVIDEPEVIGRFYREAQITAQLEHPSIVPVYRLERLAGGQLAYTMKLIRGETLKDYVKRLRAQVKSGAPLSDSEQLPARIRILIKVCEAIHFAHERGIMHRDLKPANIMIGPHGEVYVMDWGIARAFDEKVESIAAAEQFTTLESGLHADATQAGVILGTPAYMSPEQACGDTNRLGAGSDQYTLSLLLQELATLRRAIAGKDIEEVVLAAASARRRHLEPLDGLPQVPRELVAIIERGTRFLPENRYPDVGALIDDLHRFLDGQEVQAEPDNAVQRAARWLARHRQTTLLSLVGLLLVFFASTTANLYRHARQKDMAAAREAALAQVLNATSAHVRDIDVRLLMYEGLVQSLASAGVQAIVSGGSGEPSHLASAIDAGEVPDDFAHSEAYNKELSVTWASFVLAPGVDEDPEILSRLAPLRHTMRRLFLRAGDDVNVTPGEASEHIRQHELPLLWTYVGLEEGVHVSFPGKGGYPADYDPRLRPWYTSTRFTVGPQWHAPYEDAQGMGRVIPCTMALYDGLGAFRGVAGVELTLETALHEFLWMDLDGVRETWLLDAAHNVVLSSGSSEPPSVPAQAGYRQEAEELVVHYPLNSLDWVFVALISF